MLSDDQLLRYSRQIMLSGIDLVGQDCLLTAHAVIFGMGGLGTPAAQYLAAAGVGRLTLADPDVVELSNLQRQILYTQQDIGKPKVACAARRLQAMNPDIQIDTLQARLDEKQLAEVISGATVVLGATDSFSSRFAISDACLGASVPLVNGAAIKMSGQLSVYDYRQRGGPCYRCLYSEDRADQTSCHESGILGPVVGTIGTLQAVEAIKLLVGIDQGVSGHLLLFDAMTMEWQKLRLSKDPQCPVCH